jgi:hypothetical protein
LFILLPTSMELRSNRLAWFWDRNKKGIFELTLTTHWACSKCLWYALIEQIEFYSLVYKSTRFGQRIISQVCVVLWLRIFSSKKNTSCTNFTAIILVLYLVSAKTEVFITSWEKLIHLYLLLTTSHVIQPWCHKCFHFVISFKSLVSGFHFFCKKSLNSLGATNSPDITNIVGSVGAKL